MMCLRLSRPIFPLLSQCLLLVVLCAVPLKSCADGPPIRYSDVLREEGVFACLSPKEAELVRLINIHRRRNGLPMIPNSKSLNKVARIHAIDMVTNTPFAEHDSSGRACGLHSWSDKGYWSPICYTGDLNSAQSMWNKPREITFNLYHRVGYENAYWTSEKEVDPARVMELWANSPPHNDLIIESGPWRRSKHAALGVGVYKNVAVVWVGNLLDPLGSLKACRGTRE